MKRLITAYTSIWFNGELQDYLLNDDVDMLNNEYLPYARQIFANIPYLCTNENVYKVILWLQNYTTKEIEDNFDYFVNEVIKSLKQN